MLHLFISLFLGFIYLLERERAGEGAEEKGFVLQIVFARRVQSKP